MKRIRLPVKTGRVMQLDGLQNLMSGMGTGQDKMAYVNWVFSQLDPSQLEAAYRGDWIARKIVNIPAQDATREWRAWQADQDEITALEDIERQFRVQQKVRAALVKARLYGGAALILGVNVGKPDEELDIESVGEGDLKFVHVVTKNQLTAGELNLDVDSPYYGEPSYYERAAARGTVSSVTNLRIHPSRVVRLIGQEYPDIERAPDGWGDSVLQGVAEAVKSAGTVTAGIGNLVQEAQSDVIKVPDLTSNLVDQRSEAQLAKRFQLAAVMKSLYRIVLLDSSEEWQRVQANFASLPDILKMYLLIASGAADIPATRMLSQSPTGLNSTGDGDIRNYYDHVGSQQSNELQPALERLDQVLVRSALGDWPDGLHYNWRSLWKMTETEQAELANKKANTFKIDVDSGLIDENVLRKARENQLIEDGTYPGLEQILEEFEDDREQLEENSRPSEEPEPEIDPATGLPRQPQGQPGQEAEGEAPPQATDGKRKRQRIRLNKDARPRSLYVHRPVVNAQAIIDWAKRNGFKKTIKAADLHVTIMYTTNMVDWTKMGDESWGQNEKGQVIIPPGGMRMVEQFGDATVLLFNSNVLTWRNCALRDRGCEWKWDEYQPHITITWAGPRDDLDEIEAYQGEIILGPEKFEEVEDDWKEKVVEDAKRRK